MAILAIIAIIIVFASIVIRLGVGAYKGTRGTIGLFSRFGSLSRTPSAFAEEFGWKYMHQGMPPGNARDALRGLDLPGISSDGGLQSGQVKHLLQGEVEGHPVTIIQYEAGDEKPVIVWLIRLQAPLPTIGSDSIDSNVQVDPDYKRDIMTPSFARIIKQSSLPWRISGNYLISWQRNDAYTPRELLPHAKRLTEALACIAAETWSRYGNRSS